MKAIKSKIVAVALGMAMGLAFVAVPTNSAVKGGGLIKDAAAKGQLVKTMLVKENLGVDVF